jgi:hypothetical protein
MTVLSEMLLAALVSTSVGGAFALVGYHLGTQAGQRGQSSPFSATFDAISVSLSSAATSISNLSTSLFTPVPERECQELRDIARDHTLDIVERDAARVERRDGQLIATWDGTEITRYKEIASADDESNGGADSE